MSIVAGTEVVISIGDGGSPTETFNTLAAATLLTFEVNQQLIDNPAIATDGWANALATKTRRLSMTCQAAANDGAAALRLRGAALSGSVLNATVALDGSTTLSGGFLVSQYRETGSGDDAKRLVCRLDSATTVSPAPGG
ncbi:MAG: phage tail tube protein [Alphaproteobacteria bacterium]